MSAGVAVPQKPQAADQEPLATETEVADFIGGGFSKKTLANWRSAGKGPEYLKLGNGLVRYRWSAVHAWLAEQARLGATRDVA